MKSNEVTNRDNLSTADLACELDGTTAATCSGHTSLTSGFTAGRHTGPTELSWDKTLTGTEVQWGVLTLTTVPTSTGNPLGAPTSMLGSLPTAKNQADIHTTKSGTRSQLGQLGDRWALGLALGGAVLAAVLMS